MRIFTTLLEADSGSAEVAGIDVRADPQGVRERIGLSGQSAAVDEHLTGFENLDMVGRLYRLGRRPSRARARQLLEQFDLADAADRPVKTYSGGMRRRLDLAAALVVEPSVLFLDEPGTGLDPRTVPTSPLEALGGVLLLLAFAYALSWVMAYVGLLVKTPEVVSNAAFMVIFPLTFIANTFVPSENLPTVLRTIAHWNPVSSVVQASRELFGNINPAAPPPEVWSLRNPVLYSLIWAGAIVALFVPLAVGQYKRTTSR